MSSLYDYQQTCVAQLLSGKHFIIAGTGFGKTAMAMCWAEKKCKETGKGKVLVVTTASKCHARTAEGLDDFTADAKLFCSPSFSESLSSSLSLISWHKLAAWVKTNWGSLGDYVIILDEIQYAKNGISSQRGNAFLKIAKRNPDWVGFTATPGDTWLSFYPYFTACGMVKNKTGFLAEFATVQTYKGYPEIVGWRNEDRLKSMWKAISYAPNASEAIKQLPSETHKTFVFSTPKAYNTTLKTRTNGQGDFLDSSGALVAELRRLCFTKEKQEWVSDFISGLETGAVMFYNYISTGEKLAEIIEKALPDGARVWRIDGKHHEIPTAETIGPRDIVLCQWQSGSEGLNLQFLHYWVAVEMCYSYSTFIQGMGRIKRIGQKSAMFMYLLICEKGIEQDILKILRAKGEFSLENWCLSNDLIKEEKDSQ